MTGHRRRGPGVKEGGGVAWRGPGEGAAPYTTWSTRPVMAAVWFCTCVAHVPGPFVHTKAEALCPSIESVRLTAAEPLPPSAVMDKLYKMTVATVAARTSANFPVSVAFVNTPPPRASDPPVSVNVPPALPPSGGADWGWPVAHVSLYVNVAVRLPMASGQAAEYGAATPSTVAVPTPLSDMVAVPWSVAEHDAQGKYGRVVVASSQPNPLVVADTGRPPATHTVTPRSRAAAIRAQTTMARFLSNSSAPARVARLTRSRCVLFSAATAVTPLGSAASTALRRRFCTDSPRRGRTQ
jgi:hypothetical protein